MTLHASKFHDLYGSSDTVRVIKCGSGMDAYHAGIRGVEVTLHSFLILAQNCVTCQLQAPPDSL